jgi:hypothetical protein
MYEADKTPATDLDRIEITIKDCNDAIDAKTSLDRLRKNKDFKKVFLKMYLEDEPARLTSLLAHPGTQTEAMQTDIVYQLRAISEFGQYMTKIFQMGHSAKESLDEHEGTRDELMTEGLS